MAISGWQRIVHPRVGLRTRSGKNTVRPDRHPPEGGPLPAPARVDTSPRPLCSHPAGAYDNTPGNGTGASRTGTKKPRRTVRSAGA